MLQKKKKYEAQIMPQTLLKLHPKPIFVIKTKRLTPYPPIKLFINLAHAPEVPAPPDLEEFKTNSQRMFALIMDNKWDIPIVTSSMRRDTDKRGNECVVYDCVVNSGVVEYILGSSDDDGDANVALRDILVEWCIESIEVADKCIVSRDDIKFPKLKVKGELCEGLEVPVDTETEEKGDEIHELLELRRDLADDQGFYGSRTGNGGEESKIIIPGLTSSVKDGQKQPLVQDITESWQGQRGKPVTKPANNETKEFSTVRPFELKDITFDVVMRKTYDTSKYKLKITITASQPVKSSDLDLRFDLTDNKLVLALSATAKDVYRLSRPLELLLPTHVKRDEPSPKDIRVFLLKTTAAICIFI